MDRTDLMGILPIVGTLLLILIAIILFGGDKNAV